VNGLLVFALTLWLLASSPTLGPRLAASGFGAVAPSSQGGSGAGKQEDAGSASKGTTPSDAGGAGKTRSAQSQSGIDWYPFANAAFLRAQALNRPILLVVSVQWNRDAVHFVNEVLTRPEVVSIIRSRFIPILVDADLRPDIRQRYPGVSWPSMTILNPEGDPLYVPAGEASKPHRMTLELVKPEKLAAFLRESADYFRTRGPKGSILFRSAVLQEMKEENQKKSGPVTGASLEQVAELIRGSVDAVHGGFGRAPKYLVPTAIEACLMFNRLKSDPELLAAAEGALASSNGLIDPVDGGIYRLAAKEDWKMINYEKLLDRNADALESFVDAYRATAKPFYLEGARRIASYVLKTLSLDEGGFAYAQTADLTSRDGGDYYRASAEQRAKLPPPSVLRMTITAPAAHAVRALLRYASVADDPAARERALRGLAFLDEKLYTKGRGIQHAWFGEQGTGPLILEDQLAFVAAHLEAYEQTGAKNHVDTALDVARFVRDNLRDRETGLLGDCIPQHGGPTLLQYAKHNYDENCLAARLFSRLHYLKRDEGLEKVRQEARGEGAVAVEMPGRLRWADVAKHILEGLSPRYQSFGLRSADYGLAVSEYLDGPLWAFLVGDPAQPEARSLLDTAYRLDVPFLMRVVLDPVADLDMINAIGLTHHDRPPALYLAQGGNISRAAISPSEVGPFYKLLHNAPPPAREDKPLQPASGAWLGRPRDGSAGAFSG